MWFAGSVILRLPYKQHTHIHTYIYMWCAHCDFAATLQAAHAHRYTHARTLKLTHIYTSGLLIVTL